MIKFFIENYGCQMNVSESDSLRNLLIENGHQEAAAPSEAEVVIINTCSVRKTAEERIEGRLGYYRGLKEKKRISIKVIFMGCMAQSIGKEMKKRFPDVIKLVWGTYNRDGILDYFDQIEKGRDYLELESYHFMESMPQGKYSFKSFVPISHGCNNYCSYCIVPYVRGKEVYRKSKDILENIFRLMDKGVKEVTLLGQNVNSYSDGAVSFPELLDIISIKTSIPRLTFMTSHPKDLSKNLVDVIKTHDNIIKAVHLPLQSGSSRVLKLMNRKYGFEEYFEKIGWIKSIPAVLISTDIIVGFPSETEDDFHETLEALKKIEFHEAFMYFYNSRPGTAARDFSPQIPLKTKKQRLKELIELQFSITEKKLEEFIGFKTTALIESVSRKNKNELAGRTRNGLMIFLEGEKSLIGKILNVKIASRSGSGLKAKII